MDANQKYLFGLLLEIDRICKKYDIEYFIYYGSTLGAIRHEGFIPWDDDIDINMTEENYYKWVEACKKELDPSKRLYLDGRLDRDFPGIFGRYIDVESMRLASTFAFWKPVCGQSIDVFYMLELPGDPVKKQKAIDLYFVYDEYSNSSYRHYRSKTPEQIRLYRECLELEKKIGKEKVLEGLEAQIFNKHYDDCDTYIITSARKLGPVSFVPKKFYDTTYMAEFEGHKFPIAGMYAEELTYYYGDDWNIFPEEEKHHTRMSLTGIPCKVYVDEYMRFYDADELKKDRQNTKNIGVEEGYLMYEHLHRAYNKLGQYQKVRIRREFEKHNLSPSAEFDPNDTKTLELYYDIFSNYFTKQLDPSVRYWEVAFDIGDEYLGLALLTLFYYKNDIRRVAKILGLREVNKIKNSGNVALAEKIMTDTRAIKAAMVYKDYQKAKELLAEAKKSYQPTQELIIFDLEARVATAQSADEYASLRDEANELLKTYPDNDRLLKALGDIADNQGDKEGADVYYNRVLDESRDGMLLFDIKKRRG